MKVVLATCTVLKTDALHYGNPQRMTQVPAKLVEEFGYDPDTINEDIIMKSREIREYNERTLKIAGSIVAIGQFLTVDLKFIES